MSAELLEQFAILAEFNDQDREQLHELLEERTVQQGRRLFGEGSEAEGMVLVVSGEVRVESGRRSGEPEVLQAPVALGALSLFNVGPREATIVAESACEVLMLARNAYHRLVHDHPSTAVRLAEGVLDELAGLLRPSLDLLPE